MALVRNIASKAEVENASQIINKETDCIASQRSSATAGMSFRSTIQELINKDLNLCVSDKEGGFVVLDSDTYKEKASAAMAKNFIHVDAKRNKKAKHAVLKLLDNSNLNSLCTKIRKTKKKDNCKFFFSVKTDKEGKPFPAIVSEKETWQIHLSTFLSYHLSLIQSYDPYKIKNSEQLITYLQENGAVVTSGFSKDIQDMYYLIRHMNLMTILHSTIKKQGTTAFQNAAGINVDTFLELLVVYLNKTVVEHQDQQLVHKSGVCIGSRVAPQLCDLYLVACSKIIESNLKDTSVKAIFAICGGLLNT